MRRSFADYNYHACGPSYQMQYDHGIGIYPIDAGRNNPGFCDLPKTSCTYLNDYFAKLVTAERSLACMNRRTKRAGNSRHASQLTIF